MSDHAAMNEARLSINSQARAITSPFVLVNLWAGAPPRQIVVSQDGGVAHKPHSYEGPSKGPSCGFVHDSAIEGERQWLARAKSLVEGFAVGESATTVSC